jgi:hypothetical protein
MHPFTSNDIAKARSDEKVARGLAAYRALQARDAADSDAEPGTTTRVRFVHRLRRRAADAAAPARPAV